MIKIDDSIAFIAPECGALSLLVRIGDVVVAGFFEPGAADPSAQAVKNFDLPTYADRERAAKAHIDDMAIAHILDGWDLIAV
ncbi:hypothetical protein [Streptomyces viridochromogenes]|uniref:hypothetical protein n=1 Tax=Streptomyces viridochromogenes TaxID=1938 RepID=UPI00069EE614|nr:hypothetical protein [Streptomyces viridochromogenes]KOG26801.1 hypothetical protein ADK36_02245 [Streptomyces viridochromogenes]